MPLRILWLLALALAAAFAGHPARAGAGTARPNLLLFLTDDQRFDLMGCAENRIARTPHMDSLAREGVRFRNAFVTTPICAASRASILTGLYERTHRFTFGTPPIADDHALDSYPARLRAGGYRTGFVGKFGVQVSPRAREAMFDSFSPLDRNPYHKKLADGSARFVEDILGDRAVEFLGQGDRERPFCLSLSFNAPHAEDSDPRQYFWTAEEEGLYRNAFFLPPRTMAEPFFAAHPGFLKDTESRVRYRWRFDEPEKYQSMVRGYYRMVSAVDRVIGRVMAELRRTGQDRNTVVLFTSDNGYFLGERGFADKWYGYEYSLRVPMIVSDPRRPATLHGRVEEATALNVDLPPTLLALAGIPAPARYQGRSLVPFLDASRPADWRSDFFFEHLFERKNIPKSEGVRTERHTYIRWFEQEPVVEEVYDHVNDFEQVSNLIGDPAQQPLVERLRRRTNELRDAYGGPYRRPEPRG